MKADSEHSSSPISVFHTTNHIPAAYMDTGIARFSGNPFIEALPPLEQTKQEFLTKLAHYPPKPTTTTRRAGEIVRTMELATLNDVIIPFPEYQKASIALAAMIRDSYVARNPISVIDRQRRHAIAANSEDGVPFPANWKSSAQGHFMMAVSGMGKTTFSRAYLLRIPQVIEHTLYHGQPLRCKQVVYILLRIPHDASLKSLCVQFFDEVDRLIGTDYAHWAKSVRSIALMVQLMNQVATTISLGLLVVDEVQNLRTARGGNAEFVLNLFSEIIERLGISLLVLATPAVQPVLEGSVRNSRKLTSMGSTTLQPMKKNDLQWEIFCETYWEYTYVKNKGVLNKQTRDAWHDVSSGNTAFAVLAFKLAQTNAIGGREKIDIAEFERVAATDMAFLQPAIAAMRSRDPNKLRLFDDLLFGPQYEALRLSLGASNQIQTQISDDEFDEIADVTEKNRNKKKRKEVKSPDKIPQVHLPIENPLDK